MADALPKRAMLIINAQSRRGAAAFDEVRDKLTAAGLELMDAHAVQNPQVMEPIVKAAIAERKAFAKLRIAFPLSGCLVHPRGANGALHKIKQLRDL